MFWRTWIVTLLFVAATAHLSAAGLLRPSWKVQIVPTPESPFFFLHQRKSGGSSMRRVLFDSVKLLPEVKNGTVHPRDIAYIPCHFGLICVTWSLPAEHHMLESPNYPYIYGFHSTWADLRRHPYGSKKSLFENAKIFTNIRNPVERTLSCLRYRFPDKFPSHTSIIDMNPNELRTFLLNSRSEFGFGCNNEAVRILSGYIDEDEINRLALPGYNTLSRALIDASKRHIVSSVVVGMPADYEKETVKVLNHYFPWIQTGEKLPHEKMNRNQSATQAFLPTATRTVIEQVNGPEMEVYRFAKHLFLRHVSALDDHHQLK